MVWVCSFCGKASKTKRLKCPKCGNMSWRASRTRELAEIAGPMKQIAPRGLILGPSRKQRSAVRSAKPSARTRTKPPLVRLTHADKV